MTHIRLTDVTVDIPLRGLARARSDDSRIVRSKFGGLAVRALNKLNFEAKPGDRIGVRGGNGAGKSTLLRVIAGILPTSGGVVDVTGGLHALFSLGDGIRYALTGRENARLRFFLLGRPGDSLEAFLADVEAFADIGAFFDLPVSTYSPGMLSRLLFSMSTVKHADIMLFDEWIGVSDTAFQEKAAERLEVLVNRNDIFIIASHNPSILRRTTNRIVVLDRGHVVREHSPDEIEPANAGPLS